MLGSGRRAEERAARLLKKRGYKIVAKNYSCVRGEIDLVARDGEALVFVEVKARATASFGEAAAAIGPVKKARLLAAAEHYLLRHPTAGDVRFDVVAFTGAEVLVIRDAFRR